MRDLAGFKRRFWLTGFTNYRFAIPEFAGFDGRAIYNDTDQIYLRDPAELFDTPMNGAGFLSINDRDTSVMLIDCERMRECWNPRDVRRLGRKALEQRARNAGFWGPLEGGWNARDSEYDPGRSHLVHFTTLHTQPWRPFPAEFVYFDNPTGSLWPDLEKEADKHRFLPVNSTCPSPAWADASKHLPDAKIRSLLAPKPPADHFPELHIDNLLERSPDADIPWILDRLFSLTRHLHVDIREPLRHGTTHTRRSLWFWQQQFAAASRLHPDKRWSVDYRRAWGQRERLEGGPAPDGSIVVVTHKKPGHANQSRALGKVLAKKTGRPLREVVINTSEVGYVVGALLRRSVAPPLGSDAAIIVAGGWLPCRLARDLQRREPGLRLILSGRKAGPAEDAGRVVIQCRHFGLPPHPNRLTSRLPLNAGQSTQISQSERWEDWLQAKRKIAVLVGGDSRSHRLDETQAQRLAAESSAFARSENGGLLVVCSRRSAGIAEALQSGLGPDDLLYRWQPDDPSNPYSLALEQADLLIVTGESESMLADAASQGKGFLIWPVEKKADNPWIRLCREVGQRATRPRFNRRGSIRPQQGQTYACARALERGWILPPRDIEKLHAELYRDGIAAPFGQPVPARFGGLRSAEIEPIVEKAADRLNIQLIRPHSDNNSVHTHEH
jgi:hypothetical protein